MPELFLLIADAPLREALVEQIKAAGLGDPRVFDPAKAETAPPLLLIDEPCAQEHLPGLRQRFGDKTAFLLLGSADEVEGVTETFAKPLRLGHLIERVRYYLETAPLLRETSIDFGACRLEPKNRRVLCAGVEDPIRLTEKETALLVFLASSTEPATRQNILASVWGYDERIDTHTLETHIYQLRRKLEACGENWLVSDGGVYRLLRGQG